MEYKSAICSKINNCEEDIISPYNFLLLQPKTIYTPYFRSNPLFILFFKTATTQKFIFQTRPAPLVPFFFFVIVRLSKRVCGKTCLTKPLSEKRIPNHYLKMFSLQNFDFTTKLHKTHVWKNY